MELAAAPQYSALNAQLSFREKFAYGVGDFGSNLYLCIGTLYLLKFYTDILAIPAIYGGVIFLISKFFTAFTDILTGVLLDNRKNIGAKGKFRPFIFYGSCACIFVTIGQFIPTPFGQTTQIIISVLFFMGFGLCYSLMNCSYGAMVPAITKNTNERAKLASFRQAGSTLGLLTCTVVFIPIQKLFDSYGEFSYTLAAVIFAICGFGCMVFCYSNVKERYIEIPTPEELERRKQEGGIFKSLLALFSNKPLLVLAIVNLCTLGAFNIKLAMQVYYCEYVLNNTELLSYMGFFSMGCVLLGVMLVPNSVERFGKKRVYVGGLIIWIVGDFLNFFLGGHSSLLFVLFSCLAFFGTAFANSLNWALVPDTVDYGEWKTGIRSEGTVYTGYTFSRKISAAMAGFLPGILLAYVGYVPNTVQSEDTILGLTCLIFILPGSLAGIAAFTMYCFYKLDESLFNQIIIDLRTRRLEKIKNEALKRDDIEDIKQFMQDFAKRENSNTTANAANNSIQNTTNNTANNDTNNNQNDAKAQSADNDLNAVKDRQSNEHTAN